MDPISMSKELLHRLPRTFLPPLREQAAQWDLLFPAEQRRLRATLDYLGRLPAPEFDSLFAPIKKLEARMELSRWDTSRSIEATGLLVRSPYYSGWRAEVEQVFARVNSDVESAPGWQPVNKFVMCVLPAGLPLGGAPLFPRLEKDGGWIGLPGPFSRVADDFVRALAARTPPPGADALERTWVLETDSRMRALIPAPTVISYDTLDRVRREFLSRLNLIRKDLRSADRTYEELRKLPLALDREARVTEFLRNLFLSGNGALLFGNSFVQWGASEALRRAQPQVLLCGFGIRPKLKPFSSVVLFEDQNRANPTATQPDPAGSLVDLPILCEYVYLAANRYSAYRQRAAFLFAAAGLDRVLVIAPRQFPLPPDIAGLTRNLLKWLA